MRGRARSGPPWAPAATSAAPCTGTGLFVQHAVAARRSDRTSFVVADGLSTVRDADIILVVENGRIVEHGAHDHLLAARGGCAALHASPFAAPTVPDDTPTTHPPAPRRAGEHHP